MLGALADPHFGTAIQHIERYQNAVVNNGYELINEYDRKMTENGDFSLVDEDNRKLCDMAREKTTDTLGKVLKNAMEHMKVRYNRSDN